jgi:hypothetical protein
VLLPTPAAGLLVARIDRHVGGGGARLLLVPLGVLQDASSPLATPLAALPLAALPALHAAGGGGAAAAVRV